MKIQEIKNPEVLKFQDEYINKRWSQLSDLEQSLANEGIKFLFYINAGSAAATLAYIGSSSYVKTQTWVWWSLFAFAFGVFFIGCLHFVRYLHVSNIYKNWRKQTKKYYGNETSFKEVIDSDEATLNKYKVDVSLILAFISFGCFLIGIIIGLCNFQAVIKVGASKAEEATITNSIDKKAEAPKMAESPKASYSKESKTPDKVTNLQATPQHP